MSTVSSYLIQILPRIKCALISAKTVVVKQGRFTTTLFSASIRGSLSTAPVGVAVPRELWVRKPAEWHQSALRPGGAYASSSPSSASSHHHHDAFRASIRRDRCETDRTEESRCHMQSLVLHAAFKTSYISHSPLFPPSAQSAVASRALWGFHGVYQPSQLWPQGLCTLSADRVLGPFSVLIRLRGSR